MGRVRWGPAAENARLPDGKYLTDRDPNLLMYLARANLRRVELYRLPATSPCKLAS